MVYTVAVEFADDESGEHGQICVLHSTDKREVEAYIDSDLDGNLGAGDEILQTEFAEDETCPFCGESWL